MENHVVVLVLGLLSATYTPAIGQQYSGYYKQAVCTPSSPIQYPSTIDEVITIVNGAIQSGTTVKAIGSLHSITDVICTDGIPISMSGIQDKVMNADLSVTVGAGVNLHDASEFLKANNRALRTMPGFGGITIGGAIGTGAHGSTLRYNSSISEQVIGLTIINASGQRQEITEVDDLNAFRVHLGLLGIVVLVKLYTVPLYKVEAQNYVISDTSLYNGDLLNMVRNIDQVAVFWFPTYKQMVISNSTIVDVSTPGNAYTNQYVPSTSATFNTMMNPLLETIQSLKSVKLMNVAQAVTMATLYTQVPDFPPIYTENGISVKAPAIGFPQRMFAPLCDKEGFIQCTWAHGDFPLTQLDVEIGIDLKDLPNVARTVQDILTKYPAVFPIQGILIRFSLASNTYMSTFYQRDTCHFQFFIETRNNPYNDPSLGIGAYQTILQSLAFNYTGRSHWGKTGNVYHSAGLLTQNLNQTALNLFLGKMNTFDPTGVFMNNFGKRLKGVGTAINNDPLVTRCALLDNCFCSSNGDCATNQNCGTLPGYPIYKACLNNQWSTTPLDSIPSLLGSFAALAAYVARAILFPFLDLI